MNDENLFSKRTTSYFEIVLLLVSLFAFSYFIYKTDSLFKIVSAEEEPIYSYDYEQVLREEMIANLSDDNYRCCLETNSGAICQNTIPQYPECKSPLIPTRCENTASCKLGCCFDEEEGLCNLNSPNQKCGVEGGEWVEGSKCNLEQCTLGCCILGENADFVTETRCTKLSNDFGFDFDYRPEITNELECLFLTEKPPIGACVYEGGGCEMIAKTECIQKTGNSFSFHENWLCTHPSLETNCEMTQETICVEDKDGVYFVDSCGNRANIYDSLQINNPDYWKTVISLENSCGADSGNIESSDCGNCVYPVSKCGAGSATYGDNVCQSLDCKDAPSNDGTQDRLNGESWCVYDGYVGNGKDIVGSRHWKYYCLDGEVKTEPCADYRQEICTEGVSQEGDFSFSSAGCRVNRWRECLDYNNLAEKQGKKINYDKMQKKCEANVDCYIKELDFGENYQQFKCLPNYPPGLELDSTRELNDNLCGIADFECTKVEINKLFGGWTCVSGCECDTIEFTQQMNDFCVSLGDCGGYVNIAGQLSADGYSVSVSEDGEGDGGGEAIEIDLEQYLEFTKPVSGQVAEPIPLDQLVGSRYELTDEELAELDKGVGLFALMGIQVAKGIGGGLAAPVFNWIGSGFAKGSFIYPSAPAKSIGGQVAKFVLGPEKAFGLTPSGGVDAVTGATAPLNTAQGGASMLSSVGNAISAAGAGAGVGSIVAMMFGLKGDAAFFVSCATGTATMIFALLTKFGAFSPQTLIFAVVVAIILSLVAKSMGLGEIRETVVNFKCSEWQAPEGGEYCKDCTNDAFKICSGYRCNSLGAACDLINVGQKNQACIWNDPSDATPPKISPWEEALSKNYSYEKTDKGIKINPLGGGCIDSFSILSFGIKTDEAAQCKYDTQPKAYDEMNFYFGEDNTYKLNHSMPFSVPSVEYVASEFNMTYEHALEKLGDLTLYVKCKDKNGNKNQAPYTIGLCVKSGPDETAPIILATSPETESYVKYGESSQDVSFYLNEPSICKYGLVSEDFDLMPGNMSCITGLSGASVYGWKCDAGFEFTNSTNFYVRCKDQPWLAGSVNESKRNKNSESYIYNLRSSLSELEIESIEPSGDVEVKTSTASITLKIKTKGGAENGKAVCYYKFGDGSSWMGFFDSFSNYHEQQDWQAYVGRHTVPIKCEDVAGNIAEDEIKFKIIKDTSSPQIARIYVQSGNIKVITTEEADCRYSTSSCNFDFDSGASAGSGLSHSVPLSSDTYFIKCADEHENKPAGCSIIIRGIKYV